MKPFDIAQGFIEDCERERGRDRLADAFGAAVQALGFRNFACMSHVDPLRPPEGAVVLLDYPDSWVEVFSGRELDRIDPVFRHADRTARPFFWDDPAFRGSLTVAQRKILDDAARLGLAKGYTIPLHGPAALPASCSLVPDSDGIDSVSYGAVHVMASYLHEALACPASGFPPITQREKECLELAGQGKSDWVIGELLGISARTAHNHIERAKRRFGVASRMQAVVRALYTNQISFGDVIRPGRPQLRGPDQRP